MNIGVLLLLTEYPVDGYQETEEDKTGDVSYDELEYGNDEYSDTQAVPSTSKKSMVSDDDQLSG